MCEISAVKYNMDNIFIATVRGQRHAPAAIYPGKDPVPIVQEAGWSPGTVWTCEENNAPTGIRSSDRPARSQSLYRLRYRTHDLNVGHPETQNVAELNIQTFCVRLFSSVTNTDITNPYKSISFYSMSLVLWVLSKYYTPAVSLHNGNEACKSIRNTASTHICRSTT